MLPLAACGASEGDLVDSEQAATVPAVRRLELEAAQGGTQMPTLSSVQKFEVQGEVMPDWDVVLSKGRSRVATLAGERPALILVSDKKMRVDIAGDFDPKAFNQVVVEMASHGYENVSVSFHKDNKRIFGTVTKRIFCERKLTRIVFDLPVMRPGKSSADRLSVHFAGRTTLISLRSVELIHRPWARWLPTLEEGPALVDLEGEARRALGLSSQRPLFCEMLVPVNGRLAFSHGIPTNLRVLSEQCSLHLDIQDLDAVGTAAGNGSLAFVFETSPDAVWRAESVDLSALAGKRVRATFSLAGSSAAEFMCALGETRSVRPDPAARTVILITSDTHRADHLGVAGSGLGIQTPFLDGLARKGVFFADCYSSANVTRPSHAALMTGTHPRDTGVRSNYALLSEDAPTLAEHFRDAGWSTFAAVSAEPLNYERSGLGQGFDRISSPLRMQRDSADTLAKLQPWLDEADGEPLFIWLHIFDAHGPYAAPAEFEKLYWNGELDPHDSARPALPDYQQPHWDRSLRDTDYVRAQYRAEVTYMDQGLGELFQHARLQSAIVALTSDHGEHLGGHKLFFVHYELYPATLHIPLIMSWPEAPQGLRVEHPVRQLDVGRTLLNLAGLEHVDFPGHDLMVADPERARAPRFILSADSLSCALVFGERMLILHLREREPKYEGGYRAPPAHTVELFDLAKDPDCLQDLSSTQATEARKLRKLLVDWLCAARTDTWQAQQVALDAEALENLAALGYTDAQSAGQSLVLFDPQCDCERCAAFED